MRLSSYSVAKTISTYRAAAAAEEEEEEEEGKRLMQRRSLRHDKDTDGQGIRGKPASNRISRGHYNCRFYCNFVKRRIQSHRQKGTKDVRTKEEEEGRNGNEREFMTHLFIQERYAIAVMDGRAHEDSDDAAAVARARTHMAAAIVYTGLCYSSSQFRAWPPTRSVLCHFYSVAEKLVHLLFFSFFFHDCLVSVFDSLLSTATCPVPEDSRRGRDEEDDEVSQ